MRTETIHLKDHFEFIMDGGLDPTVTTYLPDNLSEMRRENEKRASVLICPGGAYAFCSQREAEPVALKFVAEGFNAFVLNYSNGECRFPVQLREAAAAMKLIEMNADDWHCAPGKTAILGFSAGGHLAANYSTMYDSEFVKAVVLSPPSPAASVLCYPVVTADERYAHRGSFENLVGHFPLENGEKQLSCETAVNEKTPPAFIWHTAADNGVPVMNSLLYAQALAEHGVTFELHVYPFGQHGLSICDETVNDEVTEDMKRNSAWVNDAILWLKRMI